jgi:hypothetical protein
VSEWIPIPVCSRDGAGDEDDEEDEDEEDNGDGDDECTWRTQ